MARTLLVIGLLQFLALFVGILRAKGLSVYLGPDGLGVVSTIDQIILTVTQLGALGIPFTALKYMSHAHSESAEAFKRVSNTFVRLMVFLAASITIASVVLVLLLPSFVGAEMSDYVTPILIALTGITPIMASALLINVLASAQKSGAAALVTFVVAALQGAAAVAGAFIGGIEGLYLASSASGLLATVGTFVLVRSLTGVSLFAKGEKPSVMFGQSADIAITAATVYCTMVSYAGALLAIRYSVLVEAGETMAGLLHAALTIALTAGSLLAAMSGLYLAPALNRATGAADKIRLAHDFAGRILALFMIGALPVVLFPGLVVTTLFTGAFNSGAAFIAGFMTWQCLYQGMNVYQQLLVGLNEIRYTALSAALGLMTAAALSIFMISKAGPGIVSLALIGGAIVSGLMMLARLRFRYRMDIPPYLVIRTGIIVVAIALAHAWFQPHSELQIAGFAARMGFLLACFSLLYWQLTPWERALVGRVSSAVSLQLSLLKARRSRGP